MSALLTDYIPFPELVAVCPVAALSTAEQRVLLLVDDDPVILNSLKKQAEKYYHRIICFDSAEHARLYIMNTNIEFDTALIDYFLPGDSGNEILSELKKKEGAKIYLMTGDLSSVPLSDVKEFDACIPKPIRSSRIKEIFSKE